MSDPYIVIEFPDGQCAAQQVRLGTTLQDLEDLWDGAWQDFNRLQSERIRVGLGHGFLLMRQECDSDAVSKLKTEWLGYRDAVLPPPDDEDDDENAESADDTTDWGEIVRAESEHIRAVDKAKREARAKAKREAESEVIDPDTFMSEYMRDRAKEINVAHLEVQTLDGTATRAKSRARSTASEAKQARIRVGQMLLKVRREHGGPERGPGAKWWGNFVMRTGIPQRTARKYMAEAERAEVSARGRNPEPFDSTAEAEKFKSKVRKLVAKCQTEDAPALLRNLADEIEAQVEPAVVGGES